MTLDTSITTSPTKSPIKSRRTRRTKLAMVSIRAAVRGFRSGDNPARWRGHLAELFPAKGKVRSVKHLAALPFSDVPAFMVDLRQRDALAAHGLEFAILTAARTGEITGATWDELDLRARTWTIPKTRMKAGKEHRVPYLIGRLQSCPHCRAMVRASSR
jgi:integrase